MNILRFIKKLLPSVTIKRGLDIEPDEDDVQFFYPGDIALKEAFDKGLITNIDETLV